MAIRDTTEETELMAMTTIDEWISSSTFEEIGLMDLIILEELITQEQEDQTAPSMFST